jgi:hypothetical protein
MVGRNSLSCAKKNTRQTHVFVMHHKIMHNRLFYGQLKFTGAREKPFVRANSDNTPRSVNSPREALRATALLAV